MLDALSAFLAAANSAQREALAHAADTSLAQLNHIVAGRREASAGLGARVERAAAALRRITPRLPKLDRRDIATVCFQCPFANAA